MKSGSENLKPIRDGYKILSKEWTVVRDEIHNLKSFIQAIKHIFLVVCIDFFEHARIAGDLLKQIIYINNRLTITINI